MRLRSILRNWLILACFLSMTLAACSTAKPSATVDVTVTQSVSVPFSGTATPTSGSALQSTQSLASATRATGNPAINQAAVPKMGVEVGRLDSSTIGQLKELGVSWIRKNALEWSKVEPVEGERKWEAVAGLEEGLQEAARQGINTILIIRSTPEWAQKTPGYLCGPIKQDKLQAFAKFLGDVVARYSAPPFNIEYYELGNEPDIASSLVPPNAVYGCWGDTTDPYYGGGYYAEMLKSAYPAMKAADEQAQVLVGGLLLDCDPAHPPQGSDCKSSLFLKGILENGGGNFFDIVSYHGYNQYWGNLQLDEHNPAWEARGGVVTGKAGFLRETLASYGIEKPLFETEGALLCSEQAAQWCAPPAEAFYESQADYIIWLYVRDWAAGISGTIWYNFEGPGWRYGSLLDKDQKPKPAYRAFQFLMKELGTAAYVGPVSQYSSLAAYAFAAPDKRIWVLWAPDEKEHAITLPEGVLRLLDKYGNEVSVAGTSIQVKSPIYVELNP